MAVLDLGTRASDGASEEGFLHLFYTFLGREARCLWHSKIFSAPSPISFLLEAIFEASKVCVPTVQVVYVSGKPFRSANYEEDCRFRF